ncbi:F9C16.5 [Arabidopsis thaliana]|uniref:F9C16.5 n=1 Tax=Arabidopsis thaliana TaxID=3702 RepID=Q9LP13_ARATH|nr:F9C16.5 [Arabidopsis thaliana]
MTSCHPSPPTLVAHIDLATLIDEFIRSISIPQSRKATLFASNQKACRIDVECSFGVLQPRFAIIKISNIMQACIILNNMIVEEERDVYNLFDVFEFVQMESTTSSHVEFTCSTYML